jgi:hypothetical protein
MRSGGYPGMGLKILLSQIYHAKDQWQEFIFVLYSLFPRAPSPPFFSFPSSAWERKFPAKLCFATLSPLHPLTEARFR